MVSKDTFEMEQQHHQDDNLPHMTRSDNEDDDCPMGTVHRCIPERPSRWLDDPNDLDQDVGDCEINVLSQCHNCNAQEIGSLPTSGTATDDPGQAVDAINDTECAIHQVCATVGTQAQMDWEYLRKF